jgi:hypothetical protein
MYVTKISSTKKTLEDEFEDTKGVIRMLKSKKNSNTMAKRKRAKGQTTIYKAYT